MSGQPKPVLPCVRCGNPGGWAHTAKEGRPARYNGGPFGYDGQICMGCYKTFHRRRQGTYKKRYRNREAAGLATMVLAFDTARRSDDKAEASRAYRALVQRARFLVDEQWEQQQQAAQP